MIIHAGVGVEPRVLPQIPTDMVRILVDPGVNARDVRMAPPVHFQMIFGRRPGILTQARNACWRGGPRESRTARWNVSTTKRGMTAAAVGPVTVLPKSGHANEKQ